MNCHHLSIEERSCIRKYYVVGLSCREIARLIGRNAGTVPREIRRNCARMTPRLATRTPVSYTHLDVYKRQMQNCYDKFLKGGIYHGIYRKTK